MTLIINLILCDICMKYKDNVADDTLSDKYINVCNTCKDSISRDSTHKLHKWNRINWDAR